MKTLRKILCLLGFHTYKYYNRVPEDDDGDNMFYYQYQACKYCGKERK
ncbi:MAG: hypothetical protein IJ545_04890 [Alphaproteobacteria bacterium]|nr:hypothetical protein [Alphaproteobacteria bacterium]